MLKKILLLFFIFNLNIYCSEKHKGQIQFLNNFNKFFLIYHKFDNNIGFKYLNKYIPEEYFIKNKDIYQLKDNSNRFFFIKGLFYDKKENEKNNNKPVMLFSILFDKYGSLLSIINRNSHDQNEYLNIFLNNIKSFEIKEDDPIIDNLKKKFNKLDYFKNINNLSQFDIQNQKQILKKIDINSSSFELSDKKFNKNNFQESLSDVKIIFNGHFCIFDNNHFIKSSSIFDIQNNINKKDEKLIILYKLIKLYTINNKAQLMKIIALNSNLINNI